MRSRKNQPGAVSFNPRWREQGTGSSGDGGTTQTWNQQSGRCPIVKLSTVISGGPSHPRPKPLPPQSPSHPRSKPLPPSAQAPPLPPSKPLPLSDLNRFSSHTLHLHRQTRLTGGWKARLDLVDPPLNPAPPPPPQPKHGLVSGRGSCSIRCSTPSSPPSCCGLPRR